MLLFSGSDPLEIAGVKGGKSLIVPKRTVDRAVRADTCANPNNSNSCDQKRSISYLLRGT